MICAQDVEFALFRALHTVFSCAFGGVFPAFGRTEPTAARFSFQRVLQPFLQGCAVLDALSIRLHSAARENRPIAFSFAPAILMLLFYHTTANTGMSISSKYRVFRGVLTAIFATVQLRRILETKQKALERQRKYISLYLFFHGMLPKNLFVFFVSYRSHAACKQAKISVYYRADISKARCRAVCAPTERLTIKSQ